MSITWIFFLFLFTKQTLLSLTCSSDADCEIFGFGDCIFEENQVVGVCEFDSLHYAILPDKIDLAKSLDDDKFRRIPVSRDLAGDTRCDNHFEEQYHSLHRKRSVRTRRSSSYNQCAMNSLCGDPEFRNQYIDRKMYEVHMNWLIVKSDNWWKKAEERIAEMQRELGDVYNKAGFFFDSTLHYYGLDTIAEAIGLSDPNILKGFVVDKYDCGSLEHVADADSGFVYRSDGSVCVSAEDLVTLLRGDEWRSLGAFQVLVVDFVSRKRLGFGKFPWSSLHGLMAFSKNVVKKGQTTIPHELGHVFGLLHVFRGYDESACGSCTETENSDLTGDMISDTFPSPLHWSCHYDDLKNKNDPCQAHNNGWENAPLGNVMNYGKCRHLLTVQQVARMKCFNDVGFKNTYTSYIGESTEYFQAIEFRDDDFKSSRRRM